MRSLNTSQLSLVTSELVTVDLVHTGAAFFGVTLLELLEYSVNDPKQKPPVITGGFVSDFSLGKQKRQLCKSVWTPEVVFKGIFFYEIQLCFSFLIICIAYYPAFFFGVEQKASSDVTMIWKRSGKCAAYGTNIIFVYDLMFTLRRRFLHSLTHCYVLL